MKQLLFAAILFLVITPAAWAQSADEKALMKVEDDWGTAWAKGDGKFLEQLYATEYWAIGHDGQTYDKAAGLKQDLSTAYTDKSFKLSDLRVHVYGQIGVVQGHNLVKFTKDGKASGSDYLFTDVFVNRDGRWQCVATESTLTPRK